MSLHLNARQRAMLQEMGITVWAPVPAETAAAVGLGHPGPARGAPAPTAAMPQPAAPASVRPAAPAPVRTASPASPAAAAAAPALRLHPAQALYPGADPAQVPAGLGAGWLIVTESLTPADPLGGDAGRLLDNMLRALQLHRHPRVFLAALERAGPGSDNGGTDIAAALADTVTVLGPAMVLVLGHVAARAALGRTEPLGRLRAEPHQVAGCPAVVTYDPAFLLRSQDNKAAAWADLCRALATVRTTPAARGG
ncbi:uracil-DNA glycosylase family protein [Acidovorax sp. NO-1]|uniref:uracil-DNA glycosylase family protein n=1 Tax=Acidovorax sp. NO-1 TaxID=512030 RepID=UPI0002D75F9C|nr:uracil-DNA glycosylase family protein [Acidovorax sp. NO-1]